MRMVVFEYSFSAPSYFDKCDLASNARNDVESALGRDIRLEAETHNVQLRDEFLLDQIRQAYAQLYGQCLISESQDAGRAEPGLRNPSLSPAPGSVDKPMRYLRRVDAEPGATVFDASAPAAPLVPPFKSPVAPAPPASFEDRFGNWSASAVASAPIAPSQSMGSLQTRSAAGVDPKDIRVLSRVLARSGGAGNTSAPTSGRNVSTPPQPGRRLGIFHRHAGA
jgi:hypothetical protein